MKELDRCSGKAIRNAKRKVIGVATAQHCSLLSDETIRYKGSDGNNYIVQPKPVKAQIGANINHLETVAEIDKYVVPKAGDNQHDVVLGVAKGVQPDEVINAYQNRSLSPHEMTQKLHYGDKIYWGGWPTNQPGSGGITQRQEFVGQVIGLGRTTTTETKHLNVLWAAAAPTKEGAVCSYGDSGAGAFTFIDGKQVSLGVASVFMDLTDSVPGDIGSDPSKAPPKLKGSNAGAVCGFSYELKTPKNGGMVLHAVRSKAEIPGFVTPEQAMAKARAEFKDPGKVKPVLHGYLEMQNAKGREAGQPQHGGPSYTYINNPLIFHNPDMHGTVIGWADPNDPDHLAFAYYDDQALSQLFVYQNDKTPPDFTGTSGPEVYRSRMVARDAIADGSVDAEFVDSKGLEIGGVLNQPPNLGGTTPYGLLIRNDKLVLKALIK